MWELRLRVDGDMTPEPAPKQHAQLYRSFHLFALMLSLRFRYSPSEHECREYARVCPLISFPRSICFFLACLSKHFNESNTVSLRMCEPRVAVSGVNTSMLHY